MMNPFPGRKEGLGLPSRGEYTKCPEGDREPVSAFTQENGVNRCVL